MKRRDLLKGLGTVLIVAVGGSAWRAYDQGVFSTGKGQAYEAWENWREESDGPMNIVRAAILAASPHNTQPWLFAVTNTAIELYADTQRTLGTMDVYLREMHIGLGCAVENMLLAADASGYQYELELPRYSLLDEYQSGSAVLVATLSLHDQTEAVSSELYNAIPRRHTDRSPYERSRTISDSLLTEVSALNNDTDDIKCFLFSTSEEHDQITQGCVRATQTIIEDKAMSQDSAMWFRHDWDDVQHYKDGPHIDTAGVSALLRAVVKMLPPVSEEVANEAWLNSTRVGCESSPVLGFIAVRDLYDSSQSVRAGQLWQRMHLWATTRGISMQPVNQMCEVVDRDYELEHEPQMTEFMSSIINEADWSPTFVFRMGYSANVPLRSARRPVEDVLIQ